MAFRRKIRSEGVHAKMADEKEKFRVRYSGARLSAVKNSRVCVSAEFDICLTEFVNSRFYGFLLVLLAKLICKSITIV